MSANEEPQNPPVDAVTAEPAPPVESPSPAEPPPAGETPASDEVLVKTSVLGFILVPAALVMVVVGIVWLFYVLTYQKLSVQDYAIKLRSPNRTERWRAALELVESNQAVPDLVPILIEMLNAPAEEQTLDKIGWESGDMLKKPEERKVSMRWYAAAALAKVGSAEAFDALVAHIEDADPGVRFYAAHGLGRIADPKAAPPLAKLLKEDADSAVRMTAAWALGQIADPASQAPLAESLAKDENQDVRWNCAIALVRYCDAAGRATLEAMVKADNPHTRDQARHALQILDACGRKK